jgi:hypothetical protein
MNIKRILLDESEKKQILSLYNQDKNIVTEQSLNSDGTYTIMGTQEFIVHGQQYTGNPPRVYIKKGATVKKNTDGKSVSVDVYYKKEDSTGSFTGSLVKAGVRGKYECNGLVLKLGEQYYYQHESTGRPFSKTMNRLFCDGNKLKGSKTTEGGGGKPKPIKKVFTEDQICRLTDDKTWIYAKDDKGVWWASRDGGNTWFELKLPKFQKAVDILNTECPKNKVDCETKCNAKPLQPGQTGPQVEMWFFGIAGCQKETGSGGFSTREECEACKCSDKIGEGGSKEDCFDKFGCLEKLIEDKILLRWDDFDECGCYHGNPELSDYGNCIFYCDGTAWCEIGIGGDGDIFNWSCNQGKIDMDKEKPIQREKPKPKKPIDGGKDDGDQDFPLF